MAYERVNWENLPSTKTPVNADNLNKMDEGIKDLETELSKKANSADVYTKTETDTKLNTKQEKLTAGTGIKITETNIINNLNANYSTSETKIGTWIDGKPLYRKVISSTLPKVETNNVRVVKTVSIGANIKTGFIEKAFFYSTNDNQIVPIPFKYDSGQLIQTLMALNDRSLKLLSNSTYTNEQPVTIIVCYTKTTD